ncbi:carbon-nitrogen family hydrolase [Gracilibacillus sp. S3-1-1]|uniref:Carbon-nitrogen family hydrolase n=1 Tax=Gracilibacillus pellucidus TaxID=3095368 RepID=A0ACC6M0H6_9BACI|nr:carbon-nitrogen family hydrolase [Gracilibacillus sp. S3-1-1]MDX8044452.1 carbon-nitrogen family hydrolase [Gracilibacillus sp. S3-1-1]
MKYAIYQMDVIVADPAANRDKIKRWIEQQVKEDKPDTIVLPEMWNAGYALDQLDHLADSNGEITIAFLSELAKQHQINIIGGSIANKKAKGIYNTSYIVNRDGELVHQYDKIHLVPMLDEPKYLIGGEEKGTVFALDRIKMGIIICYDLRFPELMRDLALQGAEVIHVVAQWPTSRKDHWTALQYARAIENQCYLISANGSGVCNGTAFAGESLVIHPSGELLVAGKQEEESTVRTSIDLAEVAEIRKNIPVFDSRVPHLYSV